MMSPASRLPLTPAEKRTVVFERDIAFWGVLLHTLVQCAHMNCVWSERWQQLLSIPFSSISFLVPTFFPRFYITHRDAFLFLFKVGFFSFPLLRKPKGIQRVLDAPATPGLYGVLVDLTKMAWGKYIEITCSILSVYLYYFRTSGELILFAGSRLVAAFMLGISLPMTFWAQIACQAFAICMIRGNESLCSTQLMTDPTTVKRLHVMIGLSSQIFLPPSAAVQQSLPPGSECAFTFTLLHLLFGILLPSLPSLLRKLQYSRPAPSQAPSSLVIYWVGFVVTWAITMFVTLLSA